MGLEKKIGSLTCIFFELCQILKFAVMEAEVAILDLAIGQQFFRRLISRVEKYVPSKFCPNRMNGIRLPSRNVIFEPKFDKIQFFDRWRPSWIFKKN